MRLVDGNSNYLINSSVDYETIPPTTSSSLEYQPSAMNLIDPDCTIDNGFSQLTVSNSEFQQMQIPTMQPSTMQPGTESHTPTLTYIQCHTFSR